MDIVISGDKEQLGKRAAERGATFLDEVIAERRVHKFNSCKGEVAV
ncbi:MAG: hypothetical protein PVH88_00420 [Ignavibacteria bacterium]|jgi:hypothetical protein